MYKVRIIPCLLFKDRSIIKSVKFGEFRMVGDPTTCARVFNERNADELMFLDIMASRQNKPPNFKVIQDIAKECFMPLTIGGGIRTLEDVDRLFEIGADKVSLNTEAIKNPELVRSIAHKYGTQSVIVSIDAKKTENGYAVFTKCGQEETSFTPVELAQKMQSYGAGEILLNSIDQDGTMKGYDIDLIKSVSDSVDIPVIAAGGCGSVQDFVDAVKLGHADAVSAASIFYFVGESVISAKNYMAQKGLNMRIL